jgi:putative membrane protein
MRCWALVLAAAAGLGLMVLPAVADDKSDKSGQGMSDDVKFIYKAASGGLHEVKLGQLAKERAADPEVKKFGERMVTDHTKANKELMAVAEQMGVRPPDHMSKEDQEEFDKFATMKGRDFDVAYIKHMVEDHKKDVAEFKKVSQSAKDARLKGFASRTLPVIQQHLTMAEQIEARIKRK